MAQGSQLMDVTVLLNDVFDGVDRVFGEVRRSGYEVTRLLLVADHDPPTASLTLSVPSGTDPALLAARFQRHPAVRDARVRLPGPELNRC